MQEFPELIFDYKRVKANIEEYKRDLGRTTKHHLDEPIPNAWGIDMPLILDKKRHYWIYSSTPDWGKTRWLKGLDEYYRCSWFAYSEAFQELWPDSQFLLMDEYSKAHLCVTQLNQMCDGTYKYKTKGGGQLQLPGITIILCANAPPDEVYPKAHPFIEARFNVIRLENYI